ncbi:IclR family transcriptional regulator [Alloyangia pacifica]|uniref:IclR family transcriptional regulator n=1 Tax=Alloyangia pacifica TaxID=311180 RepID=UPI001CD53AC3|nr:helix-turn-helix domain-containing protein [Alloyangia pacifica]MCA0994977.1 helix-turn-helix domain-containing protein [Alloyangia pacifica]
MSEQMSGLGLKEEPQKRSTTIQSISMAMRFLECLAEAGTALSLADLARGTGTGRSTAHRYMQSLVKEGMAVQDTASSAYDLGPAALGLGLAALRRVDAVEIAGAQMRALAERQAMSGGVTIWSDRGPVFVRWYRSAQFSISSIGLGDVLPLDKSACGHVFQAFLPPARIAAARIAQPEAFRGKPPSAAEIERIRSESWCELTSHLLTDVTGQAAPVFDAQGEIACVITTVTDLGQLRAPADRLALQDVAKVVNRVTGGAAAN